MKYPNPATFPRLTSLSLAACLLGLGTPHLLAEKDSPTPPLQRVHLTNGDRIQGELIEFKHDERLLWQHPDIAQQLSLDASKVREIETTSPASGAAKTLTDPDTIHLHNGDVIPCYVTAMNDDALLVETSFAGHIEIPFAYIASAKLHQGPSARHFHGPNTSQPWILSTPPDAEDDQNPTNQWTLSDGLIRGLNNGHALIDTPIPDKARIDLDFEWTGHLNLSVGLYSDLPAITAEQHKKAMEDENADPPDIPLRNNNHGNAYVLHFNAQYATLHRSERDENDNPSTNNIGRVQFPVNLDSSTSRTLSIRVDKDEKTIALFIGDTLVEVWKDELEFAGKGTGLIFSQFHQNGEVRIQQITIHDWNGQVDPLFASNSEDTTVLRLSDGQRLSGQITSIDDTLWKLNTKLAELNIPRDQILDVVFPPPSAPPTNDNTLDEHGHIVLDALHPMTFSVHEINHSHIVGEHPLIGPLTISRPAVHSMHFTPPPPSNQP